MLVTFNNARLYEERTRQGISQAMLAVRADCSIRHIRALETGKKRNPSAKLLLQYICLGKVAASYEPRHLVA